MISNAAKKNGESSKDAKKGSAKVPKVARSVTPSKSSSTKKPEKTPVKPVAAKASSPVSKTKATPPAAKSKSVPATAVKEKGSAKVAKNAATSKSAAPVSKAKPAPAKHISYPTVKPPTPKIPTPRAKPAPASKVPVTKPATAKSVPGKSPVDKQVAKPTPVKTVESKSSAKTVAVVPAKGDAKNGSAAADKNKKSTAQSATKTASVGDKGTSPKENGKPLSPVRVSPPMKAAASPTSKTKGPVSPPPKPTNPKVVKKIREFQTTKELRKDLSQDIAVPEPGFHASHDINHDPQRDRMILVVRDSYWLHASWEITRRSVERAKAAMAEYWHTVRPVLRVLRIDNSGTTNNSETILRDIEIHGGVRNWYIDVVDPPSAFRVLLGYIAGTERFHELVRSNIVTTPIPGSDEAISTHWADIAKDAERIFALSGGYNDERETKDLQDMFEDHLKRPMGAPALAQFGNGAEGGSRRHRNFHFDLDAEMIVFGSTHPNAYVTLGGEPVKVQTDGTFSVRVPLPDRRQVLPATACTRDGVDEQTIVIAVERNTKVMEPLSKENEEQ